MRSGGEVLRAKLNRKWGKKSTGKCFETIDWDLIATWGRPKPKQSFQSFGTWEESLSSRRVRVSTLSLRLVGQLDDYIRSYCQMTREDLVTLLGKSN